MAARFHSPNVASRFKTKEIPEDVWERHRTLIAREVRKGTSPEKLETIIHGKSLPGFSPTASQLRHRLRRKWRFMKDHCLPTSLEPRSGTAQSQPSAGAVVQYNSNATMTTLATGSSLNLPLIEYPDFSQYEISLLLPSSQYNQASELDVLRYESSHNHQQEFFSQPIETFDHLASLEFSPSLLDHLNAAFSQQIFNPSHFSTQFELSCVSNGLMSPSRSDRTMTSNFKELDEQGILHVIKFLLDNNLLEKTAEQRGISRQFMQSLSPKAAESINLDFCNPETAESSEKLYYFALESNCKSLITAVVQTGHQLPKPLMEAAFVFALRNQHLDLVQFLLHKHVDLESKDPCVNLKNWSKQGVLYYPPCEPPSSLEIASSARNPQLVQLLLKAKASPKFVPNVHSSNGRGREINPLMTALTSTNTLNTLEEFIGEDQPSSDDLAMLEIVQTLVQEGADVNSTIKPKLNQLSEFDSPVCAAASRGYTSVIHYLLSEGAEVQKGSRGQGALLHLSQEASRLNPKAVCKTARLLIDAGVDVNLAERKAYGPPIYAGVDVNLADRDAYRALDYAIKSCSSDLIDILLSSGAVPGDETLKRAIKSGNSEIAYCVLDSMASIEKPLGFLVCATQHGMQDLIKTFSERAHDKGCTWPTREDFRRILDADLTTKVIGTLFNSGFIPSGKQVLESLDQLMACKDWNLQLLRQVFELALNYFWVSNDDFHSKEGTELLCAAITLGEFDLVYLLLECGTEVDVRAMDAALDQGNVQLFYQLLEVFLGHGGDDIPARYFPHLKDHPYIIVKLLVSEALRCTLSSRELSPSNTHHRHKEDSSITAYAFQNPNMHDLNYLLDSGLGHNLFWLDEAVACAVRAARHDIISKLLEAYTPWQGNCNGEFGSKALNWAISQGCAMDWRQDISEESKSASLVSADMLLSFGVDPGLLLEREDQYRTKFKISSFGRIVRGKNIRDKGRWLALILKTKPNLDDIVEIREFFCYTPLLTAIEIGDISTVNLLLEAGANIDLPATYRTRKTPLQAACTSENMEIFSLLLSKGADIHAPAANNRGGTALQFAAIRGNLKMVFALLERGADANAPGAKRGGRTALEGAAEHGRVGVLELLLECGGAKIDGDGEGQYQRALELAEKNGRRKAKFMLERAKERLGRMSLDPIESSDGQSQICN